MRALLAYIRSQWRGLGRPAQHDADMVLACARPVRRALSIRPADMLKSA